MSALDLLKQDVAPAQPASIEVRDLSVTYPNGFTAVYDASFELGPGTICALVGVFVDETGPTMANILDRCRLERGTLEEALQQAGAAKRDFTVEDIFARGARTIEKCILQGTTRMRTHVEVDPVIGSKGIKAVREFKSHSRQGAMILISGSMV